MEIMCSHCAGLNIHKKSVVVCRITPKESGGWNKETRQFGTLTVDLLALADWLKAGQVTHIAMESTGIY